jgi:4-hydroxybenzoate polyprenyltransferase
VNLKSKNKLKLLKEKEGEDLVYLGDSKADFSLWDAGVKAIPVGNTKFCNYVESKYETIKKFEYKISRIKAFIKGIRPHQWAKNALIFLPLMLTKSSHNLEAIVLAGLALVAFSLCASSVYLLNDMFDLDADRVHSRKQNRPLASGALPISIGLLFVPLLLALSFFIALKVSLNFVFVLAVYYIITSVYSFKLKSLVLIDVILLAVLYTTRIFAGGAAIDVEISPWLLAFSMFFFLSLAFVKRVTELMKLKKANLVQSKAQGRGYLVEDLPLVYQLGIGTGVVSILVFSLYMSSDFVRSQYTHPNGLWLSSLFLFYWITRVWLLTSRDEMNDDPVVFAIKDKQSYFVMALIAVNFIYCM